MSISWPVVALAFVAVLAFLVLFPAPQGCGCGRRKRALEKWGEDLFGDDSA